MDLSAFLLQRVEREGPIPWDEFMEEALFHPLGGYYSRGPTLGPSGDFTTASHHPLFRRAIVRFVKRVLEEVGGRKGRVVEVGVGRGDLLLDLVREGIRCEGVERSPSLSAALSSRGMKVHSTLEEVGDVEGVLLALELLDSFPVRRFQRRGGRIVELCVGFEKGRWVEVGRTPKRPIPDRVLDLKEGEIEEFSPYLSTFLDSVDRVLQRGVLLVLDYSSLRDGRGSLRGYSRHRVVSPLERPGEIDLTADVDFEELSHEGSKRGFSVHGPISQGEFLSRLGVVEEAMEFREADPSLYLSSKLLFLPGGMGERFQALALARGVRSVFGFESA